MLGKAEKLTCMRWWNILVLRRVARRTMIARVIMQAIPARTDTLASSWRLIPYNPGVWEGDLSGRLGPNMPSSGTSMRSAYTNEREREMAMTAANWRRATVAVNQRGSAVATVDMADEATGVPISIRASLHACYVRVWAYTYRVATHQTERHVMPGQ